MSNSTMSIGGDFDTRPYWSIYPIRPSTYPVIPWKNPFEDLTSGSPAESSIMYWTTTGLPTGKVEKKMNKERPKLDRIKGLIEGFLLAVEGTDREESVGTDSLLNKILKVIEE